MLLITCLTLMFRFAINAREIGYSPAIAQEPSKEIWRVTTDCNGISALLLILPIRVTEPPFRTLSIAVPIAALAPTASNARSTPLSFVIESTVLWTSGS